MTGYTEPKNDFDVNTGMSFGDANILADDIIYIKTIIDRYVTHELNTDAHKTPTEIRCDEELPFCFEVRYEDPTTNLVVGRAWLRITPPTPEE